MTTPKSNPNGPPASLPYSLNTWIGERMLACLTLEATAELGSATFRLESPNSRWTEQRPQMLLALLTYCYATGVYASADIALRSREEGMVRYLSAYTMPDATLLKAFRRRWRHTLKQCLVKLFELAWRYRFGEKAETTSPEEATAALRHVNSAIPPALLRLLVCEAEERIQRAVQFDSMDADE